jgi:hypothetical protein
MSGFIDADARASLFECLAAVGADTCDHSRLAGLARDVGLDTSTLDLGLRKMIDCGALGVEVAGRHRFRYGPERVAMSSASKLVLHPALLPSMLGADIALGGD